MVCQCQCLRPWHRHWQALCEFRRNFWQVSLNFHIFEQRSSAFSYKMYFICNMGVDEQISLLIWCTIGKTWVKRTFALHYPRNQSYLALIGGICPRSLQNSLSAHFSAKKRVREIQFHLVKILGQLLHLPISLGLFFLTFFYFYFFVSRLLRLPLGLKELLDCVELWFLT